MNWIREKSILYKWWLIALAWGYLFTLINLLIKDSINFSSFIVGGVSTLLFVLVQIGFLKLIFRIFGKKIWSGKIGLVLAIFMFIEGSLLTYANFIEPKSNEKINSTEGVDKKPPPQKKSVKTTKKKPQKKVILNYQEVSIKKTPMASVNACVYTPETDKNKLKKIGKIYEEKYSDYLIQRVLFFDKLEQTPKFNCEQDDETVDYWFATYWNRSDRNMPGVLEGGGLRPLE